MHCITGLQLILAFFPLSMGSLQFSSVYLFLLLFPLHNFLRGCVNDSGIPVRGGDQ